MQRPISLDNSSANGKPIVAGTYTDTSANGYHVGFTYTTGSQAQYMGGTEMAGDAASAQVTIKHHLKIVITAIDGTSIKGTFSGDLFPGKDVTASPMTMTSGDFYLKLQ